MDIKLVNQLKEASPFQPINPDEKASRKAAKATRRTEAIVEVYKMLGLDPLKPVLQIADHLPKIATALGTAHPSLVGLQVKSFKPDYDSRTYVDGPGIGQFSLKTKTVSDVVFESPTATILCDVDLQYDSYNESELHLVWSIAISTMYIAPSRKNALARHGFVLVLHITKDGTLSVEHNEEYRSAIAMLSGVSKIQYNVPLSAGELKDSINVSDGTRNCRMCERKFSNGEKYFVAGFRTTRNSKWNGVCKACLTQVVASL